MRWAWTAWLIAMVTACGASGRDATPPAVLTVFAAASLRDPFEALGREFSARVPGVAVSFNFGGSNALALQLAHGAAADVFASADVRWMAYVRDTARLVDTAWVFARNRLVVLVPRDNPAGITQLLDLARVGTTLAVADEAVPAGAYTRTVLTRAAQAPGYPTTFEADVDGNVVTREENVKAVVTKVQLGEVDAGIVYRSDVAAATGNAVRVIEIPEAFNVVATYPIAVVSASPRVELARAFVAFVLSAEGQSVLARHAFAPVRVESQAQSAADTSVPRRVPE